jgi:predicted amidohydrolase
MLSDSARQHGLWLAGGTLPLRAGPGRVRNACAACSQPDGQAVARYDKIHLFASTTAASSYDEGRTLVAGQHAGARCRRGLRVGCRSATTCASPSCTAR